MPQNLSTAVVFVVLIYWVTSWGAIFMNKYVYSKMTVNLDVPYFVTLIQFISPSLFLFCLSKLNKAIFHVSSIPDIKFNCSTCLRVFPLSILFCLMVTLSNLCIKFVEVPFYQISRSLSIPMIPLLNYLFWGEHSSVRTVLSSITVVIGYIFGVDGEVNFSMKGTLFGAGASLVGTFYTIFLKRFLSNVVKSSYELQFYNNFNSCFIVPLLILMNNELPILLDHWDLITPGFVGWVMTAGLIGLTVGFTTFLQIEYTSPLSHNISGVMKNCIQTWIAAYWYDIYISMPGYIGIIMVVAGSFTYALERSKPQVYTRIPNPDKVTPLEDEDADQEQIVLGEPSTPTFAE